MAQRIRSWTIVFSDAYVKLGLGRTKHQKIYTYLSTSSRRLDRDTKASWIRNSSSVSSSDSTFLFHTCSYQRWFVNTLESRVSVVTPIDEKLSHAYTYPSIIDFKEIICYLCVVIERLLKQIIHYLFLQLPFNMKIPSMLLYSPHMLYVVMLLQVVLDLGSIASPVPQPHSLHEGPVIQDAPSPKRRSDLSSYTGWTPETKPETAIKSLESPIDHTVKLFVPGGNGVAFQIGEDMMSFRQAVRYVRNGAVASGFSVSQSRDPDGSGGTTVGSVHVSYIERESFWSAIQERAPYDTELHLTQVVFEKLGGMKFTQTKAQLAARTALLERIRNLPNAK
ncbi:hypothetical protein F5878DRAFT_16066 [Lentinula raphanica]|uniref:Uncharacterized protein n=1 Tax=Lentinula raphanica TaxID=153919 RepID=A0AA38PF37_9AGAR|nr:hypothetical protein F5878DRAFT_16066 [Lentinula raphanica]